MQDRITAAVESRMIERGLSIRAVAELSGLHHTTVSRWLSGKRTIRSDTLAAILEAMDLVIVPQEHTAPNGTGRGRGQTDGSNTTPRTDRPGPAAVNRTPRTPEAR